MPEEMQSADLVGLWHVRLEAESPGPPPQQSRGEEPMPEGLVWLQPHAEHADSLFGAFKRRGSTQTHWLAGDIDEGELILDESDDGQRIFAVWVARPTPGSCGGELRGQRRLTTEPRTQRLLLTRLPTTTRPAR